MSNSSMCSDWRPPPAQLARERVAYARLREQAIRWADLFLDLATNFIDPKEERLVELILEEKLFPYLGLFRSIRDGKDRRATEEAFLREYNNGEVLPPRFRPYQSFTYPLTSSYSQLWGDPVSGEKRHPLFILIEVMPLREALIRYFCFFHAIKSLLQERIEPNELLSYPQEEGQIPELLAFDRLSLQSYDPNRLAETLSQIAPWNSDTTDYRFLREYGVDCLDKYSYTRYVIRKAMTLPSKAKSARFILDH